MKGWPVAVARGQLQVITICIQMGVIFVVYSSEYSILKFRINPTVISRAALNREGSVPKRAWPG